MSKLLITLKLIEMKEFLKNKFELLVSLLIFSIPFSKAIPNIILVIIFFIYVIDFNKIKALGLGISCRILATLFFFLILKSILFGFFIEDFSYYVFYLIIIFCSMLFLRINNFKILKIVMLISIKLSVIISILKIATYYFSYKHLPFNDGWAVNQILVLERPYAGFFSLIAIVLSFDLYKNSNKFKILYLLSFILSTIFIFIISARISILSLIIVFIVYLFFYLKSFMEHKVILVVGVSSILVITLLLNKNLTRRFFLNKDITTTYQIAKSSEPRVIIWNCAYKITQSENFNSLIGLSSHNEVKLKLTDCYGKSIDNVSKRKWFLSNQFNTHNQFIHFYLIGGILSFILFIIFVIYSFYVIRSNFYGLSLMIVITLFLLVENLFQRQFGIYTFILSYCIYFSPKKLK